MQFPSISVIIPAYNEEETIGYVIEETTKVMDSLGLPYEIIVVDDGSIDRTRERAGNYKVKVLSNGVNRGKGYALRKGFRNAQGNIIITIDADGSHNPEEIPLLIKPILNGADIVAGSRFLGNGKDHTPKLHLFGNKLINTTIMVLTRKLITDSQTGLRAIKKEVLQKINLESDRFEIETEITVKGLKNGFKYQEVPINCRRRENGKSRIRIISDGIKIFKTIIKLTVIK
ncbi:MAG: glycosyltransferase family 2 protein [Candidatus Bathyarchaeia archaeon]